MTNYQGYSFNLHKEKDKDIIDWLDDKKITQAIKDSIRNHMKSETQEGTSPEELLKTLQGLPQLLQLLPQLSQVQGLGSVDVGKFEVKEDEEKTLTSEEEKEVNDIFDM